MRSRRGRSSHVCLAARPLATVEHLAAIARQSASAGLETCWLDLGDEPNITEAIRAWGDPGATPIRIAGAAALSRHLRRHRPVAIWLQTPYPEHYPDWFWSIAAGSLGYAGYGLTLSTWDAGLYGLETYRQARWLITESEDDRQGYLRFGVEPDRVRVLGNPLLYELRTALPAAPEPIVDVLWAPHWTEDWFGRRGFSTWRETAPAMLEFAEAHPDRRVRLRPHPLLPAAMARGDAEDPAGRAYRRLAALPNVTISRGPLVQDILECAALVTDGVSIIAYWAATGRPLAITRDASSPPFNAIGERLVELSDRIDEPARLASWLDDSVARGDGSSRRAYSETVHPTGPESPIARWVSWRDPA